MKMLAPLKVIFETIFAQFPDEGKELHETLKFMCSGFTTQA